MRSIQVQPILDDKYFVKQMWKCYIILNSVTYARFFYSGCKQRYCTKICFMDFLLHWKTNMAWLNVLHLLSTSNIFLEIRWCYSEFFLFIIMWIEGLDNLSLSRQSEIERDRKKRTYLASLCKYVPEKGLEVIIKDAFY